MGSSFVIGGTMREFANGLYKSKAWQRCREAYAKSVGYVCEECERKGRIGVPGEIVHHKIHLNQTNINNPDITMNWDNLELLCRSCHGTKHKTKRKRYEIDEQGCLVPLSEKEN